MVTREPPAEFPVTPRSSPPPKGDTPRVPVAEPEVSRDTLVGREFGHSLSPPGLWPVPVAGDIQPDDPLDGQFIGLETVIADAIFAQDQPLHLARVQRHVHPLPLEPHAHVAAAATQ